MLHRIIGRSGTGKTEYIKSLLGEKLNIGVPCVVIVPIQQSMEYEKRVFTIFGSKANLYTEVLTFDRLPNRTYREYGNLANTYVDEGGRALLMAQSIENISDKLNEFAPVCRENAFVMKMLETSRLLKENAMDSSLLSTFEREGKTKEKAKETNLILDEFEKNFSSSLNDGRDSLTSYAKNLKTMPFFKGKAVFIDSFNSFTEQQHRVIDEIALQCDDIYVTLTYDAQDGSYMFSAPDATYKRLSRYIKCNDKILPQCMRFHKKSLEYIEENIWTSKASGCIDDGGVEFYECSGKFEEAEAAASAVVKLINGGMRCRDIAVIARSPEMYSGIIDTVFEKHSIPCYLVLKESLLLKPLTVFILSAVEAVAVNFALPVMQKIIKSGYMPITGKQAELLSRYAETWSIRGKRWISESQWLMNPDGYRQGMTKYETYTLSQVNKARETVSIIMHDFDIALRSCKTGKDSAKAIYDLLMTVNAPESIRKKSAFLRKVGDDVASQRLTQLWDVIINAIDQLYSIYGGSPITPDSLLKRLQLVFGEYSLGSVPASCDAVTVGGAATFRGNSPKAVILLGVNDGVFPARPSVTSVFDSKELSELADIGLYLEDSFDSQLDNEKLFFYSACSMPSDKLICIYSSDGSSRPSVGALRLMKLCPDAKKRKFGENKADLIFSKASSREYSYFADGETKEMLSALGLNDAKRVKDYPLCDSNAHINTVNKEYITLSPTKLEKYSYCGFSYFGRYVLRLNKDKKASFSNSEIGTFIHKVLEVFVSGQMQNGSFVMPTDEDISNKVDSLTEDYILSVCGGFGDSPKRFKYAVNRLKTTLKLLLKNVSEELQNSLFSPIGFEVPANGSEYTTEKGLRVKLSGVIDRIDTYCQNGKTYVRVTDYKTGSKVFDRYALDNGLDMQMFLYMFAYCSLSTDRLPAAVTYLPARLECVKSKTTPESEKNYDSSFKRSGLILAEKSIADSLEIGEKKRFIPVVFNKDGSFRASSSLATSEEFGVLKQKVENCVKRVAALMAEGNMNISPLKIGNGYDACAYCDMKAVCRLSCDRSVYRKKGYMEDIIDKKNETEVYDE